MQRCECSTLRAQTLYVCPVPWTTIFKHKKHKKIEISPFQHLEHPFIPTFPNLGPSATHHLIWIFISTSKTLNLVRNRKATSASLHWYSPLRNILPTAKRYSAQDESLWGDTHLQGFITGFPSIFPASYSNGIEKSSAKTVIAFPEFQRLLSFCFSPNSLKKIVLYELFCTLMLGNIGTAYSCLIIDGIDWWTSSDASLTHS